MDSLQEDEKAAKYLQNITIPFALIEKVFGDKLKGKLAKKQTVTVKLEWSETLLHPDEKVEYKLWTSSNDECGAKCDAQVDFIKKFEGSTQLLEKGGYMSFTPQYMTWNCPNAFVKSKHYQLQRINHEVIGRYCAPDLE
ncbi:hypothetical protein L7F22_016257 [Adiantum nelumboides]|nr:hypothetical protein [Adiantum nelumboides]